MQNAHEAMLDKVRKLFAKADSVAGTPEAEVFNAKAYDLLAKYGIDEVAARSTADAKPAEVVTVEVALTGKYVNEQRMLLATIARALHCRYLQVHGRNPREIVVGVETHVERARILFSMLAPQMLAGAARVHSPRAEVSTATYRRSWMRGFYWVVGERLGAAEAAAADGAAAGTALVLIDDEQRAEQGVRDFAASMNMRVQSARRSKAGHDAEAADRGRTAGRNVDVGAAAVRGARALSA